MPRRTCCLVLLALLVPAIASAADSEVTGDRSTGDGELATRIISLTDFVLDNHIDPPTRQQMILAGSRAVYAANGQPAEKGLSLRASELSTPEKIAAFVEQLRFDMPDTKNFESVFTTGMLSSLKGAAFLVDRDASKVQADVINNRYVGTGIALMFNESGPQIARVFYDGPAWKAGIQKNDVIVAVDGEPTESKTMAEVIESLRGPAGSNVEMEVRQPKETKTRKLVVTRNRVFIPTVQGLAERNPGQWDHHVDEQGDIALIRITSIGPSTLHELKQAASRFHNDGVKGVVLDLRQGGGILHDIIMVADSMLDGGTIGHVRTWESTIEHQANRGDLFEGMAIAVLVGRQTSAGNVFLAAALQDNERVLVVGDITEGETYVGKILEMPSRNQDLRLSIGVMMRGDGTPLLPEQSQPMQIRELAEDGNRPNPRRRGFIVPDHLVRYPTRAERANWGIPGNDEHDQRMDPVLNAAVELLRKREQAASNPSNADQASR